MNWPNTGNCSLRISFLNNFSFACDMEEDRDGEMEMAREMEKGREMERKMERGGDGDS
jgi:hypothetical protein